ncbi:hypothetical protein A4G19_08545 [Pasteurellaceae bacterium Macca]|nr:hypothetical protein [Pasteurellaceae bacterium Macca]
MISKLFSLSFGKGMIACVLTLVSINVWLCYQNKSKEQQLITAGREIALTQSANRALNTQLMLARKQIEQYQQQVNVLHQKVLVHIQNAENRTHELINELEKNKSWANQPVPSNLSRLLEQSRKTAPTPSAPLPAGKSLPATQPTHKNQR